MEYDLNSDFDIDKHKQKYIHYLEVMIDEDGTIMYAVPSHQEKAISLACSKLGLTRNELCRRCPKEYYFDFLTWLLMQSGAVAVWECQCEGNANRKQIAALRRLKMAGLYIGRVPPVRKVECCGN